MRYLIKFSYDGTLFHGFQYQEGFRTVQECLERAATHINNNKKVNIVCSGRTDKGVHALGQIAHLDLEVNITPYKLKRALNSNLPDDIHVIEAIEVKDDFHSRYAVISKTYQYRINMKEYNPLRRHYCYQHNYPLDVSKMKDAIQYFKGTHDFRAFVTENKEKKNCIRTIFEVSIGEDQDELVITFKGNGFLRYQVRNMVGILIKVGTGKIEAKEVKEILDSKVRGKHGCCAPAEGLCLLEVNYHN